MRNHRTIIACALSAVLAACGGSGASGTPADAGKDPSASGDGRQVTVASGTITGVGTSLSVDGVSYDTARATVSDDTDPAHPATVSVGDVQLGELVDVDLDGSGHPCHFGIGAALAGLVDPGSVDTAAGRFTVLGQPVTWSSTGHPGTLFVGIRDGRLLRAGQLVKVHGHVGADGVLAARLVVVAPEGAPLVQRVRGVVKGADAAAKTFKLGTLTVAYGAAALVPSGSTIQDGETVVVFGKQPVTGTVPALTLAADAIRVVHARRAHPVVVRLGGPITAVTPVAGQALPDFALEGVEVATSSAKLTGGSRAEDLVVGAFVRVEGTLAAGVVAAAEITVIPAESQRRVVLVGPVTSFVSASSFVVRGATVDASSATFTDGGSADQLADGVVVAVLGHLAGKAVVADQITIQRPPPKIELTLTGVVRHYDASAGTFELLGSRMELDPHVVWTGGTAADLADGVEVQVKGSYQPFQATEARHLPTFVVTSVRILGQEHGRPLHLTGVVSAVTADGFVLNDVTVAVTSSTRVVNGPVAAGQRVAVLAQQGAAGAVTAVWVQVIRGGHVDDAPPGDATAPIANAVHFTGVVTSVKDATTFAVNGTLVDASKAEYFPEGAKASDLTVGKHVTVGGTMSADVVTAVVVKILP